MKSHLLTLCGAAVALAAASSLGLSPPYRHSDPRSAVSTELAVKSRAVQPDKEFVTVASLYTMRNSVMGGRIMVASSTYINQRPLSDRSQPQYYLYCKRGGDQLVAPLSVVESVA
jgi:hypothetical protein